MGNSAAVDVKKSKMEIYRALKSEIVQIQLKLEQEGKKESLSEEEFSQLAGEELASSLGVSEDLIRAITTSASPTKSSSHKSPSHFEAIKEPSPAVEASGLPAEAPTTAAPPAPEELVNLASPPRSITPAPLQSVDAERVMKLLRQATASRFHHFVVGGDGSEASGVAFDTALALRKAKGKFYVLHVEDTGKNEYLPGNMKWDAIREDAEVRLATKVPKEYFSMERIVKDPGESTRVRGGRGEGEGGRVQGRTRGIGREERTETN